MIWSISWPALSWLRSRAHAAAQKSSDVSSSPGHPCVIHVSICQPVPCVYPCHDRDIISSPHEKTIHTCTHVTHSEESCVITVVHVCPSCFFYILLSLRQDFCNRCLGHSVRNKYLIMAHVTWQMVVGFPDVTWHGKCPMFKFPYAWHVMCQSSHAQRCGGGTFPSMCQTRFFGPNMLAMQCKHHSWRCVTWHGM